MGKIEYEGTLDNLYETDINKFIEYNLNDVKIVKALDDKLKLIGWAGRKSSTALQLPGQVRLLEVPKQGAGWIFLDWKAPSEGGRPRAYKVQRRFRNNGNWADVATAIISEITLVEQPQKIELEYCVVAINKVGIGRPSNTVNVVL